MVLPVSRREDPKYAADGGLHTQQGARVLVEVVVEVLGIVASSKIGVGQRAEGR